MAESTENHRPAMETDPAFVQVLTRHQRQLYGYILSLVPWASEADDVLQETNLVLMQKAASFTPGTSFLAWACRVAYFEAMNHHRRRKRERGIALDEPVLELIATEAGAQAEQFDERRQALRGCLQKIGTRQRDLLSRFYADEHSIDRIAEDEGRSSGGLRVTLHRLRATLLECIQRTLSPTGRT